jgi:flagellar motor switch protein FliN
MTPLEATAHLHDVSIALQIELDRKTMTLRELIDIEAGGVLCMTRSAGENIDILVGETVIGFGEIVIFEDKMGVRVTDFRSDI